MPRACRLASCLCFGECDCSCLQAMCSSTFDSNWIIGMPWREFHQFVVDKLTVSSHHARSILWKIAFSDLTFMEIVCYGNWYFWWNATQHRNIIHKCQLNKLHAIFLQSYLLAPTTTNHVFQFNVSMFERIHKFISVFISFFDFCKYVASDRSEIILNSAKKKIPHFFRQWESWACKYTKLMICRNAK